MFGFFKEDVWGVGDSLRVLCANGLVDRCLQMWKFGLQGLVRFLNDC